MLHVFLETNWLVDCFAPAHNRVPAAVDLLRRARDGDLQLHLPSVCISEAQHPLRQKFQARLEADRVRRFVTWALAERLVTEDDARVIRTGVNRMENVVRNHLANLDAELAQLRTAPGIDIYPLSEGMLERCALLSFEGLGLGPYDQAVLAAVLVRAEEMLVDGQRELVFCELDADLQPWDKSGARKEKLAQLYDNANVWVYGDYLNTPPPPAGWHERNLG